MNESNWLAEVGHEELAHSIGGATGYFDGYHLDAAPTSPGMRVGLRDTATPRDLRSYLPGALSKAERQTIMAGEQSTRVKRPEMEHRDNVVLALREMGMKHREIADAMTEAGYPMTTGAVYLLLRREGKTRPYSEIPKPLCVRNGCRNHQFRPGSKAAGGLCKRDYDELRARVAAEMGAS